MKTQNLTKISTSPKSVTRRAFIKTAGGLGAGTLLLRGGLTLAPSALLAACGRSGTRKPPYRVIFSNDTTNILSCVSPYHKKGETWRPEMLEASVDEVAGHGVDAHFIQLASGQVPWYQSKVYPIEEHHRWWQERFKVGMDKIEKSVGGVHKYLMEGGDLLRVFIARCRKTGQAPFVSLRMNDMHHVEHVNTPGHVRGIHSICKFYAEHPEFRVGPGHGHTGKGEMALDWGRDEVRDWMFSLIAEQARGYDIDGFEMDFMRASVYFRLDTTTVDERRAIMLDFIKRVRAVLDENPFGRKRWLCVRIPCYTSMFDSMGIDVAAWADAGVEMFNVSPHYFTVQQTDLAKVRALVPGAAVYQEMCHSIWNGRKVAVGYDTQLYRRATREQYQTTAHLAYANGADGVSLFNFVYYREHGSGDRGPFSEPPFDVLDHLGNKAWLAKQPQHWFVAPGWQTRWASESVLLPREVAEGGPLKIRLNLAPPTGGWRGEGRLRFQAENSLGTSMVAASFNGHELAITDDVSEPFSPPYTSLLGNPDEMRAWRVPGTVLKNGANEIMFSISGGVQRTKLMYIDLAI